MKKMVIAISVLVLTGLYVYAADDKPATEAKEVKKDVKQQTVCPVEGGKINKKYFVDVEGKRIYFCCPACIPKVKADPDKYIKEMEDQGIVLEKAPEAKSEAKPKAKTKDKEK